MESESESPSSIVIPGPELREKVDNFAARLSTLDKRKADEMIAKLLASQKRNQYLYVDSSHIFYPYFLSKLTEFRQHPDRVPEKKKAAPAGEAGVGSGQNGSTKAAPTAATTTVTADGIVRTVGGTHLPHDPKREELLREAKLRAKRYLEDPFPNHYSLNFKGGTLDIPALVMDTMSCTAQYVAKYGENFLIAVQSKQKHNPAFRFLKSEDVRHEGFLSLVESYKRILNFGEDETETRLENMQKRDYVLHTVLAAKMEYIHAAVARQKAALLTNEELQARLQWNFFEVLKTFTLSDLLLDGPLPEQPATSRLQSGKKMEEEGEEAGGATATDRPNVLRPPGEPHVFVPVYMSSKLVRPVEGEKTRSNAGGEEDPTAPPPSASRSRDGIVVEENYTARAIAPVRRGVEYFVDDEGGERIRVEDLQKSKGGGDSGAVKRSRESYGLASDEGMARELQRRARERQ
ncbi:unnamed protein product [Phytomonas sp. EM1]|nr:unnamed protein product [Phytomonas sp. EM1]|eukprot:CCW63367.1 unnamed protein product [Phytomonas sp. isolate EM1]